MPRKQMVVHGRVQGVGFRATTEQIASQYSLTGWVKNNSDGTVEIVAEGSEQELASFIKVIEKGPSQFAKVQSLDITDLENEMGYENFKVLH
ncbi:acylphosphatase [Halobacillus ihumii]|uniref:acylphosphatase n=1 Tax=Halobacillus ihumii TaxID=2686092 RepID=UPI0013D1B4AA|nr:acylphosphatase [Halobacillus ihumii]